MSPADAEALARAFDASDAVAAAKPDARDAAG